MVKDVSQGISFICDYITDYKGDLKRIYLMGQSVGAHISSCALLEQLIKESRRGENISRSVSQIKLILVYLEVAPLSVVEPRTIAKPFLRRRTSRSRTTVIVTAPLAVTMSHTSGLKSEIKATGSTFGNYFRVTTFGESHGGGVGCIIDGCPLRIPLSEADMQFDLDRRMKWIGEYEN
ncbi:hypothetical protein QYF36_023798 [Acer negundo]|nr:hypothetical protein QYF36_023798 [Acer negundo]